MANIRDYEIDIVKNSSVQTNQSSADTELTVTEAAVTGRHHVVVKCDASYSSSTASGLLTIKVGTTTIGLKSVHGAGALDYGILGFQNPTVNSLISATLAAGGAGVTGELTLTTYSTGANA